MPLHSRISRSVLIAATVVGFAASGGTAFAGAMDHVADQRSDNAPGGTATQVDDHRPAGAGEGRKVG